MKYLLSLGILSLALVGLTTSRASAWMFCNHCCDCCTTICCKPYNAFTPCCFGSICCNGCCPVCFGQCGPTCPGPCAAPCGPPPCSFGPEMGGPWCGPSCAPPAGPGCLSCADGSCLGQLPPVGDGFAGAPPLMSAPALMTPPPLAGTAPPPPASSMPSGSFAPPMPTPAPPPAPGTTQVWPRQMPATYQAAYYPNYYQYAYPYSYAPPPAPAYNYAYNYNYNQTVPVGYYYYGYGSNPGAPAVNVPYYWNAGR